MQTCNVRIATTAHNKVQGFHLYQFRLNGKRGCSGCKPATMDSIVIDLYGLGLIVPMGGSGTSWGKSPTLSSPFHCLGPLQNTKTIEQQANAIGCITTSVSTTTSTTCTSATTTSTLTTITTATTTLDANTNGEGTGNNSTNRTNGNGNEQSW